MPFAPNKIPIRLVVTQGNDQKLREIAASLGITAKSGAGKFARTGSLSALFDAIAEGQLILTRPNQ